MANAFLKQKRNSVIFWDSPYFPPCMHARRYEKCSICSSVFKCSFCMTILRACIYPIININVPHTCGVLISRGTHQNLLNYPICEHGNNYDDCNICIAMLKCYSCRLQLYNVIISHPNPNSIPPHLQALLDYCDECQRQLSNLNSIEQLHTQPGLINMIPALYIQQRRCKNCQIVFTRPLQ